MSGKFISREAMSQYKREEAIRNSLIKRGEYKRSNHTSICVCGCDNDGSCHFEFDLTKYYNNKDMAAKLGWRTPDESRSDQ